MKVRCPRCQAESEYSPDNPYRPFCSKRCQESDLFAWINEEHRVPSSEPIANDASDDTPPEPQLH